MTRIVSYVHLQAPAPEAERCAGGRHNEKEPPLNGEGGG